MRIMIWILFLMFAFSVVAHGETNIMGVKVYTTLDELVNPANAAVLVLDMQNAAISTEGAFARADKSAKANPGAHKIRPEYVQPVKTLGRFLDAAREAGVLVIYLEYIHENEQGKMMVPASYLWRYQDTPWLVRIKKGTWEAQTITELAPSKGDLVFTKYRENGFHGTFLHEYLRDRNINSVLLTGTSAAKSLFMTAVGGYGRGYYPVWVNDCLCLDRDQDPKWKEFLKNPFPMYASEEILAAWKKMKEPKERSTEDSIKTLDEKPAAAGSGKTGGT
jgi:nicotinamidase-related amidase